MNSFTIIRLKRHLRSIALGRGRRLPLSEVSEVLDQIGVRWNDDVRKVVLADVGTIRFAVSEDGLELLLLEDVP
jgi:hypothetical protein